MGAWDELDTEISAELDLTGLDVLEEVLNDDEYGIFEPALDYIDKLRNGIDEGTKRGVGEIAGRNRSFQEQIIYEVCDNPSGMLASSINDEQQSEYSYLVGTIINHIYPMCVEYGRGEVYPVRAKALAFYLDGELVFRKSVGKAEPRPFVAPAYEKTNDIAKDLMLLEINHAINY